MHGAHGCVDGRFLRRLATQAAHRATHVGALAVRARDATFDFLCLAIEAVNNSQKPQSVVLKRGLGLLAVCRPQTLAFLTGGNRRVCDSLQADTSRAFRSPLGHEQPHPSTHGTQSSAAAPPSVPGAAGRFLFFFFFFLWLATLLHLLPRARKCWHKLPSLSSKLQHGRTLS